MTRDQRLAAALRHPGPVALGAVGADMVSQGPTPVPAASGTPIGLTNTTQQFVGDTSLGDEVQNQIDRRASATTGRC
jgi:hypothetical protein